MTPLFVNKWPYTLGTSVKRATGLFLLSEFAMVGASLEVMDRDARKMRGSRPFVFTNMKKNAGVRNIAQFIIDMGGLAPQVLPEITTVS